MDEKKSRIIGLILTALVLILAFAVEWFIQPGYLIKSIIKVATFGGVIALLEVLFRNCFPKSRLGLLSVLCCFRFIISESSAAGLMC